MRNAQDALCCKFHAIRQLDQQFFWEKKRIDNSTSLFAYEIDSEVVFSQKVYLKIFCNCCGTNDKYDFCVRCSLIRIINKIRDNYVN